MFFEPSLQNHVVIPLICENETINYFKEKINWPDLNQEDYLRI